MNRPETSADWIVAEINGDGFIAAIADTTLICEHEHLRGVGKITYKHRFVVRMTDAIAIQPPCCEHERRCLRSSPFFVLSKGFDDFDEAYAWLQGVVAERVPSR